MGAAPGGVSGLVVGQGLRLGLVGVGIGVAVALAVGGVLDSLLFGVAASDPVTLAGVAAGVLGVTILASWGPARRAAGVDPLEALRE